LYSQPTQAIAEASEQSSGAWLWITFSLLAIMLLLGVAFMIHRRRGFHGNFNVSMYFQNPDLNRNMTAKPVPLPRVSNSLGGHEIVNDPYQLRKSAARLNSNELQQYSDDDDEHDGHLEEVDFCNDPHQRLII